MVLDDRPDEPSDQVQRIAPHIINGLTALAQVTRVILVLDDYHLVTSPMVHETLALIIDHLPSGVHLAISSRTDPPLPLPRLRARGQLSELRAFDLRFEPDEAAAFLEQVSHLKLSKTQVMALEARIEGWAAGLQLTGLALLGCTDVDRFVRAFTGSHRYILDYLADEAFYRQNEDVQTFLLQTSVLEHMNAELCNAVTGRTDSQAMLEQLERANVFVVSLDVERRWYRYHHLFADLLRFRLSQHPSDIVTGLHQNAAQWYLKSGWAFQAIGHALAAEDYDLAIRIIEEATPAIPMIGDPDILITWLNAFPVSRARNPRVLLLYAWAHLFRNELTEIETYIDAALEALGVDEFDDRNWPPDLPTETLDDLAQVNALRVFQAVYRGEPELAVKIGEYALSRIDDTSAMGRSAVSAALGDAYRDVDNMTAASSAYAKALVLNAVVPNLSMKMDLAVIQARMGNLRQAAQTCEEVIFWHESRYQVIFPVARAHIMLADLLRERDELVRAQDVLEVGLRQTELGGYARYFITGLITGARMHLAQGRTQEAQHTMGRAVSAARESGVAKLISLAEHHQARLSCSYAVMDLEKAYRWVDQSGLSLHDRVQFPQEDQYLTLIRIAIAGGFRRYSAHDTSVLLQDLMAAASRAGRTGSLIEILALMAVAVHSENQPDAAVEHLARALSLAHPEGYIRTFTDEGPVMAEVLKLAINEGINPAYTSRLLGALKDNRAQQDALLTDRESDVLQLLSVGMTNQEIADTLVVSLNTIKTHITHIYGKLGVTNRTQAIARARELSLLSAES